MPSLSSFEGSSFLGSGLWVPGPGFWMPGSGLRVSGSVWLRGRPVSVPAPAGKSSRHKTIRVFMRASRAIRSFQGLVSGIRRSKTLGTPGSADPSLRLTVRSGLRRSAGVIEIAREVGAPVVAGHFVLLSLPLRKQRGTTGSVSWLSALTSSSLPIHPVNSGNSRTGVTDYSCEGSVGLSPTSHTSRSWQFMFFQL